MANIGEVVSYLEQIAPRSLQESYDNSGLICGDTSAEVKGIIVSLDTIETIVDEAIETGANLVVSHHPIVFSGLKSFTGKTYIERTIMKAIKNDIALYAIHTNLDNVLANGVNEKLAQVLGLEKIKILSPKSKKSSFTITVSDLLKSNLIEEIGSATGCSINPTAEGLIAVVYPHQRAVIRSICQKYSVACLETPVESNATAAHGAGAIGQLNLPMPEDQFLAVIKDKLNLQVIRHTRLLNRSIQKVAVCGGSGSFLLQDAIRAGADMFITSDYKYHQFFDADEKIVIADVGHFESEQFTIDLLTDLINGKFSNFAARKSERRTNPVHYFT